MVETALQTTIERDPLPAIRAARAWAAATTDRTFDRDDDLMNDKSKAVTSFFTFSRKDPSEVKTPDVKEWQAQMEERGITASTIYIRS